MSVFFPLAGFIQSAQLTISKVDTRGQARSPELLTASAEADLDNGRATYTFKRWANLALFLAGF